MQNICTIQKFNSLGPIATKGVSNLEGLRNEKKVKKVTQEAAPAGITFCLKALGTNHSTII